MELRHLETLVAIVDEGTFTAAADVLRTTQSNVSVQIHQLERELGTRLLDRGRQGATPTESGRMVLARARRIRQEVDAMRVDVASVEGLQTGEATLGVVGTASRWIAPDLVGALRQTAPGVRLRITEAPSERLADLVIAHELAQAIVTEPITDHRLDVEHLLDEPLVGLASSAEIAGSDPVGIADLATMPLVLPPTGNPLRREIDAAAAAVGVTLPTPVEVDGVRLIVDIVAAGSGVTVLPATAIPADTRSLRVFDIAEMPRRRLALITARDAYLSLADHAARESLRELVARHVRTQTAPSGRRRV